jgi:hypothetical protein
MKKYREAEDLYLRSINISLRLFGKAYSGLEYDYRGLLHVYEELCEETKYLRYCQILENWRLLRIENNENPVSLFYYLVAGGNTKILHGIHKYSAGENALKITVHNLKPWIFEAFSGRMLVNFLDGII